MLNRTPGRLLGAVLLTACSHHTTSEQHPPPTSTGTSSGDPALSLDVNADCDATAYRGAPLLVRVAVYSASGDELDLGLTSGAWTDALHLLVTDPGGAMQTWPLQLVQPTSPTLTLKGTAGAEVVWLVAPEDTHSIAAGTYSLTASLDTTSSAAAGAWSGSTTSSAAGVTLDDEPPSLSAEDEASKYLVLAAYARVKGDTQGATSALDTLMLRQPDMLEAYVEKGDLLSQSGDYAGALDLYQEALDKFDVAHPDPPEPLTLFTRRIYDASTKLAAARGSSP